MMNDNNLEICSISPQANKTGVRNVRFVSEISWCICQNSGDVLMWKRFTCASTKTNPCIHMYTITKSELHYSYLGRSRIPSTNLSLQGRHARFLVRDNILYEIIPTITNDNTNEQKQKHKTQNIHNLQNTDTIFCKPHFSAVCNRRWTHSRLESIHGRLPL